MGRLRHSLAVFAGAGLLGLWFFFLRPGFLGGPAGYIIVSGRSMEPTLYERDLALVLRQDEYRPGDIIAYRVEGGIVIHRIIGGDPEQGFITRGDNREGPDLWRPKPADIIGRLWVHIPGAGRWLERLREPPTFAALAAGLAALSLAGEEPKPARRRNGRRAPASPAGGPGPAWALGLLALAAAGALAFGVVAFFAFRQPLREQVPVERLRYEHTATLAYTVLVQPSSLYPDGIVGPVTPASPGASPAGGQPAVLPPSPLGPAQDQRPAGPPIFTRQARELYLAVDYKLKSDLPADVSGEYSARVEIRAGPQGWTRTLEALPPTPFSGPAAAFSFPVDFGRVWAVIDTVEKETDFRPGSYEVRIVPTVRVRGRVGPGAVDDGFSPAFTVRLSRNQLTPDADLVRSEPRSVTELVGRDARLRLPSPLPDLNLPVGAARVVGAGGLALSLLGAGLLAGVAFLGLGRPEPEKIRARYGSVIVAVAAAELKDGQVVRVASIEDLARVAERQGQVILHQVLESGEHRYFIPADGLVYEYVVPAPGREG